jgi:hypothetical protein
MSSKVRRARAFERNPAPAIDGGQMQPRRASIRQLPLGADDRSDEPASCSYPYAVQDQWQHTCPCRRLLHRRCFDICNVVQFLPICVYLWQTLDVHVPRQRLPRRGTLKLGATLPGGLTALSSLGSWGATHNVGRAVSLYRRQLRHGREFAYHGRCRLLLFDLLSLLRKTGCGDSTGAPRETHSADTGSQ